MAYAGHKCKVRVSGSPLTLTDAPTTELTEGLVYQITDTTKRVLDPKAVITVKVDADGGGAGAPTTASASTYTLNRLSGTVTFNSAQAAAATVTISGSYLPMSDVAEAYEFSYSLEGDNQDSTRFQDKYIRRQQGQKDVSAELSAWHNALVKLFTDALQSGSVLVMEFFVNNVLDMKAWMIPASDEVSGAADGLLEESIEFEGTTDNDGRMVSFI